MIKKYMLYLFRWQLSTPILSICIVLLPFGSVTKTVIANLIGGLIFFWVDRLIFDKTARDKILHSYEVCNRVLRN